MTRVLIVEDDDDTREAMTAVLEDEGHEVSATGSGKDGLMLARAIAFDVVLSDLGLPDLDGWSVAKLVRRAGASQRARIYIITGWGASQAGRHPGLVDGVMTKPFNLDSLFRVVAGVWEEDK